ncbi:alpha-amylase, partial [Actinoplanes sp. NPDC048791]
FEGRRVRLPVFLGRHPAEAADPELRAFHRRLVTAAAHLRGEWQLLDCHGWPDNPSHHDMLAWSWHDGEAGYLIVLNFADRPGQARVHPPWPTAGSSWRLTDLLDGRVFDRDGDELAEAGLYADLSAWGWHVLQARAVEQ